MLFNSRRIHQGMARVGKHVTNALGSAHSWAWRIDRYAGLAKRTLSTLSGVLDSSGVGKQVLGGAVKALGQYDQIRDRAMTRFEQAENVRGALKKKASYKGPTVKKIYISSDKRVSGSESDFNWQLPFSERVPQETEVLLDAISIPNVFYTVDSHNCNLYWGERNTTAQPDTRVNFKDVLVHGNYTPQTLGVAIQTKMNARSLAFGYKKVYAV